MATVTNASTIPPMDRPFASFPEKRVETPNGPLWVVANGANTLCIRTDSRPGVRDLIAVRGVEYSINAHVTLEGGEWRIAGATTYEQRQYLHVSRVDWKNHGEASEPARKAIATLVLDVARRESDAAMLRNGRLATINNEIGSKAKKAAELREQLIALEVEIDTLRAEEDRLEALAEVEMAAVATS